MSVLGFRASGLGFKVFRAQAKLQEPIAEDLQIKS